MLGIAGKSRSLQHVRATADVINTIAPHFIRLRTFLPKINTPLLADIEQGRFQMLGPHEVLREILHMVTAVNVSSQLTSDHYTNYVNIQGRLPDDRERLVRALEVALTRDEASFRPYFVGNQQPAHLVYGSENSLNSQYK